MLTSTPGTCGRWAHSPQNSPSDSPLRAHRGLLGPRHTRREQRGLKNEPVRLRTERQESKGGGGKSKTEPSFSEAKGVHAEGREDVSGDLGGTQVPSRR